MRRADRRAPDPPRGERESRTSRAAITRSHTVWDWSAGVGELSDGRAAAWNLVSGINDPPERSERAIWIDGTASEPAPVRFEGLDAIELEGGRLEFSARCERRKEERRAFVSYSYRQPFGSFTGTLPGGLELAEALRGDGAPRRPLVVTGYTDSTRQRQGGCSPGANSYWSRPSRVSSATRAGIAVSSSGVVASRATSALETSRATSSQPSVGR